MNSLEMYNIDTDPILQYEQYQIPLVDPTIINQTFIGSSPVTVINGGGGGSASGPNVTFSGGTTGLQFAASGNTITMSGVLIPANGGTGQSTYAKGDLLVASAAAVLSKLAAAANDARLTTDSTQTTGLAWVAASTGWGAASGTLSRAAYASYAGQVISNPPTQAEVQALDDAVKLMSETLAALITDLTSQRIIKA